MNKKWFFLDFDGTLRNSRTSELKIIEEDLKFVRDLIKDEHKFVIATGRPYAAIKEHLEVNYQLYPDYFVCNAGAFIANNTGEVMYSKTMNKKYQNMIIDFFISIQNEINALVFATIDEEHFAFYKDWEKANQEIFMGMAPLNIPLEDLKEKELLCFKVTSSTETWNKITNWLAENGLDMNLTSNSIEGLTFSEIHANGVTKGNAIRGLQKTLKFSDEQVIVAGDDLNDLSMFEEFYETSYITEQIYNEKFRNKAKNVIQYIHEIDYK